MESDNGQAIIIYGASTTVGVFATQLAKRAGFHVVGVAGSSADYAKSAGADLIVDYRGKSPEELVRFSPSRSFITLLEQNVDSMCAYAGTSSDLCCRRTTDFRRIRCCIYKGYDTSTFACPREDIAKCKWESDFRVECQRGGAEAMSAWYYPATNISRFSFRCR